MTTNKTYGSTTPTYQERTLPENPLCAKEYPELSKGVPVKMHFGRLFDPLLGRPIEKTISEVRTIEWGNGEGVDLYIRIGEDPIVRLEVPWHTMDLLRGVLNRALGVSCRRAGTRGCVAGGL